MGILARERDWDIIIRQLDKGMLTPFISQSVAFPRYKELLRSFASYVGYPYRDRSRAPHIAQFRSVTANEMDAKAQFLEHAQRFMPEQDFAAETKQPLRLLADLDLPLYVTTSYYDAMERALKAVGKEPRSEICYWKDNLKPAAIKLTDHEQQVQLRNALSNHFTIEDIRILAFDLGVDHEKLPGQDARAVARELVRHMVNRGRITDLEREIRSRRPLVDWEGQMAAIGGDAAVNGRERTVVVPSVFEDETYVPNKDEPLVYHIYGRADVLSSLVMTEDDYLEFLVNASKDPEIINTNVSSIYIQSSLLLLGYQLQDWDFRVLLRGAILATKANMGKMNVAIQFEPDVEDETISDEEEAREYLQRFFSRKDFLIYWGSELEFMQELREWKKQRLTG